MNPVVNKEGQAFSDYGEMRFAILRQLVADAAPGWKH
jgi:hypothetical protein